jgi:hypothetical protein
MVRLPRTAAVKDGPSLGPHEGLVLDGCEHGGRLVWVGIDCCCMMPPLIIDRGEISDRGVSAAWIVELYATRPTVVRSSMRWRLPIRGIPGPNELFAFMR